MSRELVHGVRALTLAFSIAATACGSDDGSNGGVAGRGGNGGSGGKGSTSPNDN